MKRVIKANTDIETDAKDLLFNMLYNLCVDTVGVRSWFRKSLTREEYYEEFDDRFENDVNHVIINLFGRDFDLGQSDIDIIARAILDKAAKDDYFAYKKPDSYDELIEEWGIPVVGE